MEERKSIVDLVEGDSNLQKVIGELVKNEFLLPGIFDPRAYLRDTIKIETAWRKKKLRINAIAAGVSCWNELFASLVNQEIAIKAQQRGGVRSLKEMEEAVEDCQKSLLKWQKEVKKIKVLDYDEIEEISSTIGQYLECMNRKSQGF